MAFSLVAHGGTSGLTSPLTTAGANTTGANLIVLCIAQYPLLTIGTVSDSKGNTWIPLTAKQSTPAYTQLFYCLSPTVGTGHTFTLDNGGSIAGSIAFQAWSGADASGYDQENGATASAAATIQPGSITPPGNGYLFVTGLCSSDGTSGANSINSSYTISDDFPFVAFTSEGNALAYFVQGTAGALNPTWTVGAGTGELTAAAATFKPAAGGTNITIDTAGAITVAGQTTAAGFGQSISGGAIGIAGQTISARIDIEIDSGAMVIAGQSVTATFNDDISIDITTAGAISIAGQSLSAGFSQALSNGAITVAGQTVTAAIDSDIHVSIDSPGNITLRGQDLVVTGGGNGDANRYGRDGRRRGRSFQLYGRG